VAGQDQREPLPTVFAARFINGGIFDGGTDLIVWRDSKAIPTGVNGPYVRGTANRPRFSVGFDAIKLDSACQPNNIVFIP
jgi:hypothetical protein